MRNFICLIFNFIGLKKVKEAKKLISFAKEDDCCVCLSSLTKEGEDVTILPCLHHFHSTCLNKWFKARRKTCPICRFIVEDEKKEEEHSREMMIWYSSFHVTGLSGIF